jgi:hypothetical protein
VFVIVVLYRDFCRASLFGGAAVLLLSLFVVAQENKANDKAAIRGTITDQTQAVVTGATVVLSSDKGLKQDIPSRVWSLVPTALQLRHPTSPKRPWTTSRSPRVLN